MEEIKLTEGDFVLDDARYAIVCSRAYHLVAEQLEKGAVDTLMRHGTDLANIDIFKVPSTDELPLVAKKVAETSKYEAIIILGVMIDSSSVRFKHCTANLSSVSLEIGLPMLLGLLVSDNIEQAIEQTGTAAGNKGKEAALSAIEMVSLMRQIG